MKEHGCKDILIFYYSCFSNINIEIWPLHCQKTMENN